MSNSGNGTGPGSVFDYSNNPTWRIFRIMSEFVEGFTFLACIEKSVTFFGSARLQENHPYYQMARELGFRLAKQGYTIVTGGGPGIMQAGNQGAWEAGGDSVGLNIQLPKEQRVNPYVKQSQSFHYFFSRKVMLDFSAEAYVFFPGGFGTLDEFFELITLVQTGKMERTTPIIMMGRAYWEPLTKWMESELLNTVLTIAADDLKLWHLTDDIDEAVKIITSQVEEQQQKRLAKKGRKNITPDEKLNQATQPMSGKEQ
ncbi:MAG TPA: TIGR00730 family Rossman fold protein [Chloroflexia bacterium]|nr:TIGR00730 family Rossman fold protein [Chloroflexia bacterium]